MSYQPDLASLIGRSLDSIASIALWWLSRWAAIAAIGGAAMAAWLFLAGGCAGYIYEAAPAATIAGVIALPDWVCTAFGAGVRLRKGSEANH